MNYIEAYYALRYYSTMFGWIGTGVIIGGILIAHLLDEADKHNGL